MMNTGQNILVFIIETFATLFLIFVLLRFFLQLVRADFYNPLSQGIVKITNPVLIPMRRVIPGMFGIDLAAILLALLVQLFQGELICLVLTGKLINPANMIVWGFLGLLRMTLYLGYALMIIVVVSSFLAPYNPHPALTLSRQLLEPILAPIRNVIPPVGGFDFSVLVLGIILFILEQLLYQLALTLGLSPVLIIGF